MNTARRDTTTSIVDSILRLVVTTSVISAGILIPNLLIALDKPLNKYLSHLDKRSRERELRRIIAYMKSRNLINVDYEHGLQITTKGRTRLNKAAVNNIQIERPKAWDQKWRLVFFDIPEEYKSGRDALTSRLRRLEFYQLQRSVWIHPFPCRKVIEIVAAYYLIDKYVSYIETSYIDNQQQLIRRFKNILKS